MRNNYQRIVRGETILQPGVMNTQEKFRAMFDAAGLSPNNKHIIDVGCNLGEMCRLAKDAGASFIRGIDCEPEYVWEARKLNPDIPFDVRRAERCTGNYDIAICSGMLHYCDLDRVLAQLARCVDIVIGDVWLDDAIQGFGFGFSNRHVQAIPSGATFERIATRYFGKCDLYGPAPSPDPSTRTYFKVENPKHNNKKPKARILYGNGGAGKTSRGRDLRDGKGYEHLELDAIFLEWRINVEPDKSLSIMNLVDELWGGGMGTVDRLSRYLDFHASYLERWLSPRINLDVVIEGYDAIHGKYRAILVEVLERLGWEDIESIDVSGEPLTHVHY